MSYTYYPGCSLEGTALEFDVSTRACMQALGAELIELEDWTCCGASAAEPQSYLLSMVLPARNLALAQQSARDILIPCSACYLNLKKVDEHIKRDDTLCERINEALSTEGLTYRPGHSRVRHILDVLSRDIGAQGIRKALRRSLSGLRVAPYYGCQILRPYKDFDDPERPTSMEPLIEATGATTHAWDMGPRCCGAGLMTTKKEVALRAVTAILSAAKGADCIATVCPMCQMNLEAFQKKASALAGEDLTISVLYLPQLLGIALALEVEELGLHLNLALTDYFRAKLSALPVIEAAPQAA